MVVVDCGVLSSAWIRQAHATDSVVYTWDGQTARLLAGEQSNFFCSGEHEYVFTLGTDAIEFGLFSTLELPYQPFLMGLGGLLCGLLIAWAFMKSL
jgi:hypothetical protein